MKKIAITGFNGFVGRHACREFKSRGYEVFGISNGVWFDEYSELVDSFAQCDLADSKQTDKLMIPDIDVLLNLAGYATNTGGDAEIIKHINVKVHTNLLERIIELGIDPKVIAVSSGAIYEPNQEMPENENAKLKDASSARPYELSKILMERALDGYFEKGLNIIKVRPFNHIGPGQGTGFIVPDLANKLLEAKKTGAAITTGNLDTGRDYTDVRDVVRAYADLAEAEHLNFDTYNVCSNKSRLGSEILRLLISAMRLDDVQISGRDENLIRKDEASIVYGSHERITEETGWSPVIKFKETIEDFVAWRLAQ